MSSEKFEYKLSKWESKRVLLEVLTVESQCHSLMTQNNRLGNNTKDTKTIYLCKDYVPI